MKFSEQWLREHLQLPVDTNRLCEQLTMAGLEVDAVTPAAPLALDGVVVGEIQACQTHPDADELVVCRVDVGTSKALQIVCGAPNARKGLKVAVALAGAQLPAGVAITDAEIRGVASQGMLCASAEIGLDEQADGLLELDADAIPGTTLSQHLQLDDQVIEIDLTPNRGDCLSLLGVAREAAVANTLALDWPAPAPVAPVIDARIDVDIQDRSGCPIYCGRLIEGVDAAAPTPDWMRERLRRAGVRSLGLLVDVTQYVMLELGQPMHAFDADRITGSVHIRRAVAGEQLRLLDHSEINLEAGSLLIADETGPLALAGIMGGEPSSVTSQTRRVFLEAAHFTPDALAGEGRRYKLHTDALHRFERGVDPKLPERAIERATALVLEVAGGRAGPATVAGQTAMQKTSSIRLRHARLTALLGCDIEAEAVVSILANLGMQVESGAVGEWRVMPPSFRFDVQIEADLIEEVARVHGYDMLPARARRVPVRLAGVDERRVPAARVREQLLQRGYSEAVTYGFVDPALQAELNHGAIAVDVDNPIAAQYSQMRTTLWSSLLPAWQHNQRRQESRIRLFEQGLRFWRDAQASDGICQIGAVAAVVSGLALPESWANDSRAVDFYDIKADVEALFQLGRQAAALTFSVATHPALHPGRSAAVHRDGRQVGWLGELHPRFKKILNVKKLPLVFELNSELIAQADFSHFQPIADFPSVRRDLALLVPDNQPAGNLLHLIESSGEKLLKQTFIFDVYKGADLENGFKSVALGLIFQDDSSTLTDSVVDQAVERVVKLLSNECGARIRG